MSVPPNLFPDPTRLPQPYMVPGQAQRRAPTDYENLLGDALEAAFGAGAVELADVVARLNADGIRTPEGQIWTPERFQTVLAKLAAAGENLP